MGNIKTINIKNRTCYYFDDMINVEDFDSSLVKIDKSCKTLVFKTLDISRLKKLT